MVNRADPAGADEGSSANWQQITDEAIEHVPVDKNSFEDRALLGVKKSGTAYGSINIRPSSDAEHRETDNMTASLSNTLYRALACLCCRRTQKPEDEETTCCCTPLGNLRIWTSQPRGENNLENKTKSQLISELHKLYNEAVDKYPNPRDYEEKNKFLSPRIDAIFRCNLEELPASGKSTSNYKVLSHRCLNALDLYPFTDPHNVRNILTNLVEDFHAHMGEINDRVQTDLKQICQNFDINEEERKNFTIKLDTGETHNRGRGVAFIEFPNGKTIVYKPRDMRIDELIAGSSESPQSLFGIFNTYLKESNLRIPTYNFLTCQKEGEHYGYCQYISQKGEDNILTEEEMTTFYETMGAVQGIAQIFGITDLHRENMIVHEKLPYFVDLEVSFNPKAFLEKPIGTDLADAIVEKETKQIDQSIKSTKNVVHLKKGDNIIDFEGHLIINREKYFSKISDGFNALKEIVSSNSNLRVNLEKYIQNLPEDLVMRFVPMSTGKLINQMYFSNQPLLSISSDLEEVRGKKSTDEQMTNDELDEEVTSDLTHIDVPKMVIHMDGKIFYNEKYFKSILSEINIRETLLNSLSKVSSLNLERSIWDKLEKL